jgi:hypothetical protein
LEPILTPDEARTRLRLLNAVAPALELADESARDSARRIRELLDFECYGRPTTLPSLALHVLKLLDYLRGGVSDPYLRRRTGFGHPSRTQLADNIERTWGELDGSRRQALGGSVASTG